MFVQQRKHPRFKVSLPVEVHAIVDGETSVSPLRCATSDICLGGCYIESMYPFPVGASLELKLQAGDTLLIFARVVTCDPQFGNGIEFLRMLPEDRDALSQFLDQRAQEESAQAHRAQ
jgi:c-di-GMP-binding flagellar brake protein YcgR